MISTAKLNIEQPTKNNIMEAYTFDISRQNRSIIKVIGVGGGGSNAVTHMFNQGIKDVEFIVCNTDSQALKATAVPNRLNLGVNLTQGLGAGANPEIGKQAAIETREEIRDMLSQDTKMVFITAGMGGGTGTGAAPVIAKIAKEMDILTVGIVTAPFSFEGKKKMKQAQEGIDELRECCDTVLVILNDKLREIYGNLTINNAFAQADNVLTTAAKGIAEIITVAGYVNVDFQDVKTVMMNAGAAVMGSSEASGENRARRAAEEALLSPLLDSRDIMGAENILLSIISGDKAELQMDELTEITEYIQEQAGDHAEVIFGHGVDPELDDKIRVTVIATGFDSKELKETVPAAAVAAKQASEPVAPVQTPVQRAEEVPAQKQVFDLEKPSQYHIFEMDNSVNNNNPDDLRLEIREEDVPSAPEDYQAPLPVNEQPPVENTKDEHFNTTADFEFTEEDDDEGLLFQHDDDFESFDEEPTTDQHLSNDGLMQTHTTRERLQRQAQERLEKIRNGGSVEELDTRKIHDKNQIPAYLRRSVKLDNVPHSADSNVSKYKLNDDNQILGNNRFLYDNVD